MEQVQPTSQQAQQTASLNFQHFKDLLLEKREQLTAQLAELTEDVIKPDKADTFPEAPADQLDLGSETADKLRVVGTVELLHRQIEAVDRALERIANSTYGTCDGCDSQIEPRRLELVPEAMMCMDCKRAAEEEAAARKKGH